MKGWKNKVYEIFRKRKNELCLFDQYCLYKTYLSKKEARISLDLRVDISRNKIHNNRLRETKDERMIFIQIKIGKNSITEKSSIIIKVIKNWKNYF